MTDTPTPEAPIYETPTATVGGLNFNLKALIQSPIFWMAVGAGVVIYMNHRSKRAIQEPRRVQPIDIGG